MSTITITETIIQELIKFRKQLGYSREEVAELIGVQPWAVKYLETSKKGNITTFVTLLVFYRDMGFDINALLDRGKTQPNLYIDF